MYFFYIKSLNVFPNYQPQNKLFCIILSKNGAEKQEMRQISHNYDRFTYHTPSRGELQ